MQLEEPCSHRGWEALGSPESACIGERFLWKLQRERSCAPGLLGGLLESSLGDDTGGPVQPQGRPSCEGSALPWVLSNSVLFAHILVTRSCVILAVEGISPTVTVSIFSVLGVSQKGEARPRGQRASLCFPLQRFLLLGP